MDDRSFDQLTRALGGASTRRGAIAALSALLAGGAALDAEARRRRGKARADAPKAAGKRRNKKRCKPECTGNFSCVKGACVCETALCGGACCDDGQICQRGRCVGQGTVFCLDLGDACGDGAPCCDGLQCGSGYGGGPVACWPVPGGECIANEECAYGHHCANGACVVDAPPEEPDESCTPTTCAAENASCGSVPDGCGGTLECGACPGGQTCGGAGTAGACGCATVTCTGGKTQDPTTCACACPTGQADCNGTCTNPQADAANCGTCGTACTGGKTCQAGVCAVPQHVASFGASGTATDATDGLFKTPGPSAIFVDAAGTTAWVADRGNGRIAVWTLSGGAWSHTSSFGTSGTATGATDGLLKNPWGIFVDAAGTTAWVADTTNARIAVWQKSGGAWSHTASFGTYGATTGSTDGKFLTPWSIFVDAAGTTAWVTDTNVNRVTVWEKSGGSWSHTASFGTVGNTGIGQTDGKFFSPYGIFVDAAGTTAWIADDQNYRIAVWEKSGGTWGHTASFGTQGNTGLGQTDGLLSRPTGVVVDAAGTTAWIADQYNHRVAVWEKSGGTWAHTASFGTQGTASGATDGKLNEPRALAVRVDPVAGATHWVADFQNGRIAIWR